MSKVLLIIHCQIWPLPTSQELALDRVRVHLKVKPHQTEREKDYSEERPQSDCDGAGLEKGYPEVAKLSDFGLLVKLTLGDEGKVHDQEIHCPGQYAKETCFQPPSRVRRNLIASEDCDSSFGWDCDSCSSSFQGSASFLDYVLYLGCHVGNPSVDRMRCENTAYRHHQHDHDCGSGCD